MSSRTLDGGGTFVVWASPAADDGEVSEASCPHGVSVDMLFDTLVPQRSVVLSLREVEHSDGSVHAELTRYQVTCLLDSGDCVANDDASRAWLAQKPWFTARLQAHMKLVRARAERAAAQVDRRSSARRALRGHEAGTMIAFDELFPHDWDLLVAHDGAHYWVIDQYCANPNCDCGEIAFDVHELAENGETPKVGHAKINVHEPQTKIQATSALIIDVYKSLWAQSKERLRSRLRDVRTALSENAPRPTSPKLAHPQTVSARPTRNAPCPCGSGKKFKRCCLGANSATRP